MRIRYQARATVLVEVYTLVKLIGDYPRARRRKVQFTERKFLERCGRQGMGKGLGTWQRLSRLGEQLQQHGTEPADFDAAPDFPRKIFADLVAYVFVDYLLGLEGVRKIFVDGLRVRQSRLESVAR